MDISQIVLQFGLLYMVTKTGLSTKCILEVPTTDMSSDIKGRYSNGTLGSKEVCILHLGTDEDRNILANFHFIDREVSGINIQVFDGMNTSAPKMFLDPTNFHAINTILASRGRFLTIAFLESLKQKLNITLKTIETKRSYRENKGIISIPQYSVNRRLQYPKNIQCEYNIYPAWKSTTLLAFKDINIIQNPDKPELMLIKSDTDIVYNISCYPCDSIDLMSKAIPLTAYDVSIILDSNKNGATRGRGFTAEYEVCYRRGNSSDDQLELPVPSFKEVVGPIRCTYRFDIEDKNYLPIISMQLSNKQQIDPMFIEIYDANTTLLANWTDIEGINSFAGTSAGIILVLNYNSSQSTSAPILTGDFTSTLKDCNTEHLSSTGHLTSTKFYGKYANNFRCNTTIRVKENAIIILYFETISLAAESDPCGDYIQLYEEGRPMENRICNSSEQVVVSRTNEIIITFVTNEHTTDEGFTAVWKSCGGLRTSSTGVLMESAYLNYVISSSPPFNCSLTIIPQNAEHIYVEEINVSTVPTCLNGTNFSKDTCKTTSLRKVMRDNTTVQYSLRKDTIFTIKWTACPQIFNESSGEMTSHAYPSEVMSEMNCTYEIFNQTKGYTLTMYIDYDIGTEEVGCPNSSLHIESTTADMTIESLWICGSKTSFEYKKESITNIFLRFYVTNGESGRFKARYEIMKDTTYPQELLYTSFPWKEVGMGIGLAVLVLVALGVLGFYILRNKQKASGGFNQNTNATCNTNQNVTSNYDMITLECTADEQKKQTNFLSDIKLTVSTEESPYVDNPAKDTSRSFRAHKAENQAISVNDSSSECAYSQVNKDYKIRKDNSGTTIHDDSNSKVIAEITSTKEDAKVNHFPTFNDVNDKTRGLP